VFTFLFASVCVEEPAPPLEQRLIVSEIHTPTTGWDPLYIHARVETTQGEEDLGTEWLDLPMPTVIDGDGRTMDMSPFSWSGYDYGHVADPPLAPGHYVLTEVAGLPLDEPVEFEISGHGQEPAVFEVGAVYELDEIWSPQNTSSVLVPYLVGFTWLEVLAVHSDAIEIRVVHEIDGLCTVFKGEVEVDGYGNLLWEDPGFVANGTDVPFDVKELRLSLALSADGESLAGVEAQVILDTRPIDQALETEESAWEICSFVAGFAVSCLPCSDDEPRCLGLAVRSSKMVRVDKELGDPPVCGADFSNVQAPTFDFDIDCGCSTRRLPAGLAPVGLGILGLVIRRRRREHP
jgi:hypothetical protein